MKKVLFTGVKSSKPVLSGMRMLSKKLVQIGLASLCVLPISLNANAGVASNTLELVKSLVWDARLDGVGAVEQFNRNSFKSILPDKAQEIEAYAKSRFTFTAKPQFQPLPGGDVSPEIGGIFTETRVVAKSGKGTKYLEMQSQPRFSLWEPEGYFYDKLASGEGTFVRGISIDAGKPVLRITIRPSLNIDPLLLDGGTLGSNSISQLVQKVARNADPYFNPTVEKTVFRDPEAPAYMVRGDLEIRVDLSGQDDVSARMFLLEIKRLAESVLNQPWQFGRAKYLP